MLNVNKAKLLSERASGVPPVIFIKGFFLNLFIFATTFTSPGLIIACLINVNWYHMLREKQQIFRGFLGFNIACGRL